MSCGRESKNIWWYLFTFWPNYAGKGLRWRGWDLFTKRWWRSGREYIIHDSFMVYFNRFVRCKISGHGNVVIDDDKDKPDFVCINCHKRIEAFVSEVEVDAGVLEDVIKFIAKKHKERKNASYVRLADAFILLIIFLST